MLHCTADTLRLARVAPERSKRCVTASCVWGVDEGHIDGHKSAKKFSPRARTFRRAPSAMATRNRLAALGRQLSRASTPFVGQGVPTLAGPPSVLPAAAFAATDAVECVPLRSRRVPLQLRRLSRAATGAERRCHPPQAAGPVRRAPCVAPNRCEQLEEHAPLERTLLRLASRPTQAVDVTPYACYRLRTPRAESGAARLPVPGVQ
jgi:hypothetical protein